MRVTGVSYGRAGRALDAAGGETKVAIVMLVANVNAAEARDRLARENGFVRKAIGSRR